MSRTANVMNAGHRTNMEFRDRFVLRTSPDELDDIQNTLRGEIEQLGYNETDRFAIRLAFEEALSNAAAHGNHNNPDKMLTVTLDATPERVTIEIEDEGEGFEPNTVPDPTAEENLEIPAGRGLTLIRAYMNDVEVIPPGNRIRMTYTRETVER